MSDTTLTPEQIQRIREDDRETMLRALGVLAGMAAIVAVIVSLVSFGTYQTAASNDVAGAARVAAAVADANDGAWPADHDALVAGARDLLASPDWDATLPRPEDFEHVEYELTADGPVITSHRDSAWGPSTATWSEHQIETDARSPMEMFSDYISGLVE